jgi:hypothetical protein
MYRRGSQTPDVIRGGGRNPGSRRIVAVPVQPPETLRPEVLQVEILHRRVCRV